MEISAAGGYEGDVRFGEDEEMRREIGPLPRETLSPIDYKTQVLMSMFFGWSGIDDFAAGNYSRGAAKLAATIFLGKSLPMIGIAIRVWSLVELTSGQRLDGDELPIRQVVQIHKEEISEVDHHMALILCASPLGLLGVHQFYSGKPLKGVLMLLTGGGLGIWMILNTYELATCTFRDGEEKLICPDYIKQAALD